MLFPLCVHIRWFSWGVVSLPEGKSRGLCLVQLCAKYRLVSATSSSEQKLAQTDLRYIGGLDTTYSEHVDASIEWQFWVMNILMSY